MEKISKNKIKVLYKKNPYKLQLPKILEKSFIL